MSIFSHPNFFLNLFSHIVKGQTKTGENIKCRIQVLTGNHTQNGSFITNTATYTAKGYNTLSPYSRQDINACGGEIIGYVNREAVYATIADAVNQAGIQGCMGYHTHIVDGVLGYMACESHDVATNVNPSNIRSYETNSVATARMTADGPCICREYQTQPDGSNKCIRWSPPGCGDAPFMTADEPQRGFVTTPAPRTTPTAQPTPRTTTGGGGGSYGGGY